MTKTKRLVFSFDERSYDTLERIKHDGRFSSLADAVRQAVEVSGALQRQAQQGYTEVTVRNPETGIERVLVIPPLVLASADAHDYWH